ncbi:DUF2125 domain-containing protein [Paracoccus laeviglucosivorans]|uniref:DUF2125 domain-containing protein n=1 Tax=Paracoccus laeviglucosivorans TaxID=1197861 RepID=A0A521DSS4_9RHOB|nr:DUF2125 domain-containing protein [Paracoccus laeviglucosivorans]SMO74668.1 hypothetical protein SAMN06265221_109117 [Paracoccus laeviglucosivorans]
MSLRLTSSALALAAFSAPAFADVTPEQVWQSWVDYYQSVGYTVTEGSRDQAGSTLTLKDVTISGGSEASKIVSTTPEITLTDEGDGRVKTVFADKMTMDVSGTEAEGGTFSLPVALDMPGNSILTSGAPEDMTHTFDYPTIDVTLTTITNDGTESPLPMKFGLTNTKGDFHIVSGSPNRYDYNMASDKLTFEGDVSEAEGQNVKFAGTVDGIRTDGTMSAAGPFSDIENQMADALAAGLAMNGKLESGNMAATFEFAGTDENGQPSSGQGKYDGKGFDVSFNLSKDGMGYQAASDAIQFEMTSPQFPMPIRYALENASFDMQLPVMQQDAPQPFKFAYSLAGLTLGDEIWGMFDPQAQLPRDPASLELDVTGLMKVTENIFTPPSASDAADETATDDAAPADDTAAATTEGVDPAAPADDAEAEADMGAATDEMMDEPAEPSPFEPTELTINQFALNAVGAKINATGALKAPESGDMTAPVGQVHAEYEGVNGLLDKLGAMGLIPEDQMMGVRMMLAMFAKPVDGNPEKLVTDLEFKEGGSIFANGQQIK